MTTLRRRSLHPKARRSKACGKRSYLSRIDAELALADLKCKDSSRREKIERRCYYCSICRGWHLTSQPFNAERRQASKQQWKKMLAESEQQKKRKDNVEHVRSAPMTDSSYMSDRELEEYAEWVLSISANKKPETTVADDGSESIKE